MLGRSVEIQFGEGLKRATLEGKDGESGLHQAIRNGDFLKVQLLVEQGASLKGNEQAETPLHWACRRGCSLMVWYLLEAGASPQAEDHHGHTPLEWAVMADQPDPALIVSRFVSNSAIQHALELANDCNSPRSGEVLRGQMDESTHRHRLHFSLQHLKDHLHFPHRHSGGS